MSRISILDFITTPCARSQQPPVIPVEDTGNGKTPILVNKVVPSSELIKEAVAYASSIAINSPDSIICSRLGLREGWETAAVERAVNITLELQFTELQKGENIKKGTYHFFAMYKHLANETLGLLAFTEKRAPIWKASRL